MPRTCCIRLPVRASTSEFLMLRLLRSWCSPRALRAKIRVLWECCGAMSAGGRARLKSCASPSTHLIGCSRMAAAVLPSLRSAAWDGSMPAPRQNACSCHAHSGLAGSCRRRRGQCNRIALRCTDEVVVGQPAYCVRREQHAAIVVADFKIGMVIFNVRNVRKRVHETHGAVEIPELEFAPDRACVACELPFRCKFVHQLLGFDGSKGRHAALARFAASARQIAHGASFRV